MKNYLKMNDIEKYNILNELYHQQNKSFQQIAESLGTYANKVRRDAKKLNIKIRDKSQAQKNALQTGVHKHPTKGQNRDDSTKNKIGLAIINKWDSMSDSELAHRKKTAKQQWNKLSDDQKSLMSQSANKAVRETSKSGSKLEKFILKELLKIGYKVDFHKEQLLSNTKLQIDLFIPSINVAIEVDGPSHFLPVWGQDALDRNIRYDNKKTGLILGKGCVLIRIKQTHDFSNTRALLIFDKLQKLLEEIKVTFPKIDNRTIEIED